MYLILKSTEDSNRPPVRISVLDLWRGKVAGANVSDDAFAVACHLHQRSSNFLKAPLISLKSAKRGTKLSRFKCARAIEELRFANFLSGPHYGRDGGPDGVYSVAFPEHVFESVFEGITIDGVEMGGLQVA
ncbi:hypothetical protein GCM10027403_14480 [Arthrobacter tecti]